MVAVTQTSESPSQLLGPATGMLTLRVLGSEHGGRILRIKSQKCLIGSDPSCTLRLRGAGIRPFHCLVLRGSEGMFVRRWSPDTCLNGCGFDMTRLRPGDRLEIGPIELEVLEPSLPARGDEPIAPPSIRSGLAAPAAEPSPAGRVSVTQVVDVIPAHSDGAAGPAPSEQARKEFERERRQLEQACETYRRERDELTASLAEAVAQRDRDRSELSQECHELRQRLQDAEGAQQRLQAQLDQHQTEFAQQVETKTLVLEDTQQLLNQQKTELEELRAAYGRERGQLQASQASSIAQAEREQSKLTLECQSLREQLEASKESQLRLQTQLDQQQAELAQQAESKTLALEEAQHLFGQRRQELEERHEASVRERDELRTSLATSAAEAERERSELAQECQHLRDQLQVSEEVAQQLQTQLDQQKEGSAQQIGLETLVAELRREKTELTGQLENQLSRQQELIARAEGAEQQVESLNHDVATLRREREELHQQTCQTGEQNQTLLQQRETELAAAKSDLRQQQQKWNDQLAQLQVTEEQLQGQLQLARDDLEKSRRKIDELTAQVQETSQQLATREAGTSAAPDDGSADSAADVATWKDVADGLRQELQHTRDEHQRVREEWHLDRQNLEQELARRSEAVKKAEQKQKEQMQGAEELIFSLQKEGKDLLKQLEEARQTIRHEIERKKKSSPAAQTVLFTPPHRETAESAESRAKTVVLSMLNGGSAPKQVGDGDAPSIPAAGKTQLMSKGQFSHAAVAAAEDVDSDVDAHFGSDSQESSDSDAHEDTVSDAHRDGDSDAHRDSDSEAREDADSDAHRGNDGEAREDAANDTYPRPGTNIDAIAGVAQGEDAQVSEDVHPSEMAHVSEDVHAKEDVLASEDVHVGGSVPVSENTSVCRTADMNVTMDRDSNPDASEEGESGDRMVTREEVDICETVDVSHCAGAAEPLSEQVVTSAPEPPSDGEELSAESDAGAVEPKEDDPQVEPASPPGAKGETGSDEDGDPADDEGVIQRYMERLLKRMGQTAGDEQHGPVVNKPAYELRTPYHSVVNEQYVPRMPGQQDTPDSKPSEEPSADSTGNTAGSTSPAGDRKQPLESRPPVPEMAADLLAMRELANNSARYAISRSDRRRSMTRALSEMGMSSVCIVSSVALASMGATLFTAHAVGGVLGFSFGSVFFLRGLRSLVRLRSKRVTEPVDA